MTIRPRLPVWAAAAGIPQPGVDETCEAYWARIGIPDAVVAASLANLKPRAEDCANDRIACWLHQQLPRAFDAYVGDILDRTGRRFPDDATLDQVLRMRLHTMTPETL